MRAALFSFAIALVGIVLLYVLAVLAAVWRAAGGVSERPAETGLPFDPKSLDFARGVEFGLLFASVKDRGCAERAVHADMAELVMRLAESRRLPFSGRPHEHDESCAEAVGRSDCKDGGEWLDVRIGPG